MNVSRSRLKELREIARELEELGVTIEVTKRLSFTAQRKMMDHLSDRLFQHQQNIEAWIRRELREEQRQQ